MALSYLYGHLIELESRICALNHANIGLDNDLWPDCHQAITQLYAGLLSVRPANKLQWNLKWNSYVFVN